MKNEDKGCGIFAIVCITLTAILAVLRMFGVPIRWFWIISPLWIPAVLVMLILMAALIVALLGANKDEKGDKK